MTGTSHALLGACYNVVKPDRGGAGWQLRFQLGFLLLKQILGKP